MRATFSWPILTSSAYIARSLNRRLSEPVLIRIALTASSALMNSDGEGGGAV